MSEPGQHGPDFSSSGYDPYALSPSEVSEPTPAPFDPQSQWSPPPAAPAQPPSVPHAGPGQPPSAPPYVGQYPQYGQQPYQPAPHVDPYAGQQQQYPPRYPMQPYQQPMPPYYEPRRRGKGLGITLTVLGGIFLLRAIPLAFNGPGIGYAFGSMLIPVFILATGIFLLNRKN